MIFNKSNFFNYSNKKKKKPIQEVEVYKNHIKRINNSN